MGQGVARKSIGGQKDYIDEHDQRAEADTKFAIEVESFENVIPEKAEEQDGEIEKIAMNVLQDERKASLTTIVFAEAGFAHSTGGWIEKEGPIVSFAVVVASGGEAKRGAEDEDGGRKFPPTERKER